MRARALYFVAPRKVEIRGVDVEAPRAGEVVIRTEFSGISAGTEMLAYRGEVDPTWVLDETIGSLEGSFAYPFRYGYSCVGAVERSTSSLAEAAPVFAFHPHQDHFVARVEDLVPLQGADPRLGTLLPLVETALQVAVDVGASSGDAVMVVGLGVVGTLAGALIERSGALVIGTDPLPWRQAAAASFGIRVVSPDEVEPAVTEATDGRGLDFVVEASGNPSALGQSLDLLRTEGTCIVASWYGTKPVTLPLGGSFHRRRLTVRSSQVSTIPASQSKRWDREGRRLAARDLLTELPLSVLASHAFDFDDAPAAYEAIDRGTPGLIHAAIRYP
jgi:2-desacetyl-2-hydroxyethyl bacteriochlorophyllide A dehydrogenase